MPANVGYGKGPVQSQTLYAVGSFAAAVPDSNFTTLRATATPGAAGAETMLATYDVPPGMTVRLQGGRKFRTYLESAPAVQQVTGALILVVEHADGSRTIFAKVPFLSFGTVAQQLDENFRNGYTMTAYASGKRGDSIKVLADDGGTAILPTTGNEIIDLPVDYRLG